MCPSTKSLVHYIYLFIFIPFVFNLLNNTRTFAIYIYIRTLTIRVSLHFVVIYYILVIVFLRKRRKLRNLRNYLRISTVYTRKRYSVGLADSAARGIGERVTPRGRPHASYCCETTQLCRTAAAATALGLAVGVAVPKQDAFVRTASRDGRAVVPTSRPHVTPPLLQLLLPLKQMSRRPPCLLLYHLPLNLCLCPHRLLCPLPRGQ